jgi:hypothetical protein
MHLGQGPLADRIVTGDAKFSQKGLAEQIVAAPERLADLGRSHWRAANHGRLS